MNANPIKQHYSLTIKHPADALEHLAELTGLSKQLLKSYALKGAVWLTQSNPSKSSKPERLRRLKKALLPGMVLDFYYFPELLHAEQPPAQIIADKQGYSVWLKPRGMLSQGSKWGDHTALYRWVEMHYKPNNETRQSWIVHRLDRATQGLILLAHTKKMAQTLSHYFEIRQIHKAYQANVWGRFPAEKQTISLPIDNKTALSHITLKSYSAQLNISRIEIEIETGRKHQIRRHLSESGFPIIGDRLYGDESMDLALQIDAEARPDLQLTAYKLSFLCPISQQALLYELTEQQLDLMTIE